MTRKNVTASRALVVPAKASSAALVATPRALKPGADDVRLAERAIEHIQRLDRRARIELVVEIGDYLVSSFYGGSLDLARSSSPTKPAALAHLEKLAEDRDIARTQLRYAVALSVQYRELPTDVRDRLTMRQHRAILPVKEPRAKVRYARQAVKQELSGEDLSRLVRGTEGRARTGRPAMSEVERAVKAAQRALVSGALEGGLAGDKLRTIDAATRARLRQSVKTLRERIERIGDALERAG